MTTETERKRIYKLFTELNRRVLDANTALQENGGTFYGGGIFDDEEYQRHITKRNQRYDVARAMKDTCNSIWAFYKSLYSDWDINLAIQEGEGRIGTLPVVDGQT